MESSKNFDMPLVVSPEFVERRLVRAFVFLRQHERKAKLAKKVAELSLLKDQTRRTHFSGFPSVRNENAPRVLQQEALKDQPEVVSSPAEASESMTEQTRETVVKILEQEIEELQKTINFKDFETTGTISAADLSSALRALHRPTPKAEVQWIIWEVDDDVDRCIDWDEFRGAYARCVADKQCREPSQLFYLIQFLISDPDGSAAVSVVDVKAELQRIRGSEHLVTRIKKALGTTTDQQEQERHALEPYMDAMLTSLPVAFAAGSHFPLKQ